MALQGNLIDLPLIDILQLFTIQNKTGLLCLSHSPYTAELFFNNSAVYAANIYQVDRFTQSVKQTGLEAVYELLSWDEGEFSFEIRNIAGVRQSVFDKTATIILEYSRRKDELEERKRYSQIASICPQLVPDLPYQNSLNLELDQWHILMQMNGQNSVAQIAQKVNLELSAVVEIVQNFKSWGLCDFNGAPRERVEKPYTETTIQRSWKIEVSESTTITTQAPPERAAIIPIIDRPSQRVMSFPAPRPPELAFANMAPAPAEKPRALRNLLSGIMSRIRGL